MSDPAEEALAVLRLAKLLRACLHYTPEPNTGCHLWTRHCDSEGYAYIGICADGYRSTHRMAPMILRFKAMADGVAPLLPPGTQARHLCHQPACVNWDHIVAGSASENRMDSLKAGRLRQSLTVAQAQEVRAFIAEGFGVRETARAFGIAPTTVRRIVQGKSYRVS